ncbi:heme ABC transporter ATP-binding protein [Pleomorphomonas carboxyditropha]|uniref:Heme ABC transporter ATP-binding protein n=2 Tax=Pleomorphomonas carboxyditropha TaxID=2023338 RepID=A0A2G9WZR1_9HYPH|nr:heme ABC transporter ATP-binding protein [Pleomorphomonas carboxyditropha]PIP00154.1 heme ABC transporter ATP-binding protein [Pleomorphomonas carboxyditropha]
MIRADHLSYAIGGRSLVSDIDLGCTAGSVTVVIGPNGAGKSTLLRLVAGELRPSGGTVRYGDTAIAGLSAAELATRRAVVPQAVHLAFSFTLSEVTRMGCGHRRNGEIAARDALARVGLDDLADRQFHTLSGGEQQRAHVARALVQLWQAGRPPTEQALLLDEPTASLDLRHQIRTLELARAFAAEGGTVLAVLHDLNLAAEFADHVVLMLGGCIVQQGPPAAVIADETVSGVYEVVGTINRLPARGVPYFLPQSRSDARNPTGSA